jgi:hypothetical protein
MGVETISKSPQLERDFSIEGQRQEKKRETEYNEYFTDHLGIGRELTEVDKHQKKENRFWQNLWLKIRGI